MGANSKIEWTHHTFNPWRGCTKVSAGCANCYAETLSGRNHGTLGVWGPNGTRVIASESMWRQPLKWDREAGERFANWQLAVQTCVSEYDSVDSYERPRVFCASLADVFEDWTGPIADSRGLLGHVYLSDGAWGFGPDYVSSGYTETSNTRMLTMQDVRARLFALIDATPNLDWLLLTKRPENIAKMMPKPAFDHAGWNGTLDGYWHQMGKPRPNLWLGVSCENQQAADERIPHLLRVPAKVRFLSCEPLLGPVDLHARPEWFWKSAGIHWVIVGGESGPGARPMHPHWARSLRDQCQAAGVPFHFKQWGEWFPSSMYDLDSQLPAMTGRKEVYVGPNGQVVGTASPFEHGCPCSTPPGFVSMVHVGKKAAGRLLDGRTWDELPA